MEIKTFFAQNSQGTVIANANVHVYNAGTLVYATGLKDQNGAAIQNPFTSDAKGLVQFAAPNGDYDLRITSGLFDYKIRVRFVDIYEQQKKAEDAAQNASAAVLSQLQNIKTQTEYARDQALAGLGAVDNSQLTAVFMEQLAYLADLAGVTARDLQPFRMTDIRELLADQIVALGDIAGLAAREVTTRAKLVAAPATAASAGTKGEFAYDSSYIYVCTANNTWKRVGISTW